MTKSYGPKTVVENLTLRVLRGDRLGIIGPNGAGKTTLLNLLTGNDDPDTGEVRIGTSLEVVTLTSSAPAWTPTPPWPTRSPAAAAITVLVNGTGRHVIGYMKDFLFKPEQARTPVGVLSGGERARVMLACALAKPSNLIVLDEPTNDLDLETLDLLQDMLAEYPGTVLLVSHDRDFLDRVVTSTLAAEGAGAWIEYAGGYSDMLNQRGILNAPTERPRAPGKAFSPSKSGAKKLSFKDKHALETLPTEIARLNTEIATHQARLAAPNLYRRDPTAFAQATTALLTAQSKLATAEERWLDLEMQREQLEA